MDYQKTAKKILDGIGGKKNISFLEHCSTRLRFTLVDNKKVNITFLEKIDGVMGVRQNAQTQVIIGNEVNEVFDEVQKLIGDISQNKIQSSDKKNWGSILLDFLVGVFQPLVPAIAGGGVLKSLLMLFSLLGWMDSTSTTYTIFTQIGDAPLYFLPLLVAYTTAKKLKVNELVATATIGVLLLPSVTTLLTDGTKLFGFTLQNITYSYQVFPAILTVLLYAVLEKVLTKYTPKPIRIFFVPMVALAITAPISLLVLGPLGYNIGQVFASVIVSLYEHLGWIATALLAAILPFMVATGMHKAMIPYAISVYSKLGSEALYLPASLAHNISESGASFAVALKTKDEKLRATAISAGISALFGITEPALYGVTIQHKKVLYSVVASSFLGGSFIGLTAIKGFALVGPGLASMTMYVDNNNSKNLLYAIIAFAISLALSFIFTLIFYKDENITEEVLVEKSSDFYSPVKGEMMSLSDVNDDVFSEKLVGDGIAIKPSEGVLYAPVSGEITVVYKTGHAIAMKTSSGAEILFHVGLDTVQLQGKYFEPKVEVGAIVEPGDELLKFDIENIANAGYETTVMVLVTNQNDFNIKVLKDIKTVNNSDVVMTVERKDEENE